MNLRLLVLATVLAVAALGSTTGPVAAYGRADHPLAQIELSGNCNNVDFPLCFPPASGGVGLGGIWLWIEIDANGTGDVAGAGCGHIRGVGGGADPIRGDITWTGSVGPQGLPFFVTDPNNLYYNVAIPGQPFVLALPQTVGHYAFRPAPGVTIQLEVAP